MTTWREEIAEAMTDAADPGPIISCTLDDGALDLAFNDGFGLTNGAPFTAWTERRVYFPVQYDGREWVGSAPRNPCAEVTRHQGGG